MILLSDILGVSALVDALNSAQAHSKAATESSVLGPFHNDANILENGQSIGSEGVIGEPMLIHGTVRATDGVAIEGVEVDVWETNGNGFYDMQDPGRSGPDCRGIFRTDSTGRFYLVGVKSVDYNIPDDGPVGVLLKVLGRNITRPAHVVGYSLRFGIFPN
jgi:protocatechuate 3,4-dioxygenase beta subunit